MAVQTFTLAQVSPSADTPTVLFTVPYNKMVGKVKVIILNPPGNPDATIDLAVRPATETLTDKHYVSRGQMLKAGPAPVEAYLSFDQLPAGVVVEVTSDQSGVNFHSIIAILAQQTRLI